MHVLRIILCSLFCFISSLCVAQEGEASFHRAFGKCSLKHSPAMEKGIIYAEYKIVDSTVVLSVIKGSHSLALYKNVRAILECMDTSLILNSPREFIYVRSNWDRERKENLEQRIESFRDEYDIPENTQLIVSQYSDVRY